MSVKERLRDKAEMYVFAVILIPLALAGFYAVMDARHDVNGAAAEVRLEAMQKLKEVENDLSEVVISKEVRQLKRERRKLANYQRLSPNSEYSASREAEISALTDEIAELEDK